MDLLGHGRAACIHVAEEYCFGWLTWAQRFVPDVTRFQFVVVNCLFIMLMIAGAVAGPRAWVFSLSTATVLFINAWVYILPSLATQTYSPGWSPPWYSTCHCRK